MKRTAQAIWTGALRDGKGTVTLEEAQRLAAEAATKAIAAERQKSGARTQAIRTAAASFSGVTVSFV